jgi:isopentenyl-diphosphate delta-isomerase
MTKHATAEEIILVDEHDFEIGRATKLEAHQNGGRMHRAFSIFVFNNRGEMLLQRRASTKYHFAGLWTNSCCSHPRSGISLEASARDRLRFEFGFDTRLIEVLTFIYRAHDPVTGLSEYEFDHVFIGRFNDEPRPNPNEIEGWRWVCRKVLLKDLEDRPEIYTPWLHLIAARVFNLLRNSTSLSTPRRLSEKYPAILNAYGIDLTF